MKQRYSLQLAWLLFLSFFVTALGANTPSDVLESNANCYAPYDQTLRCSELPYGFDADDTDDLAAQFNVFYPDGSVAYPKAGNNCYSFIEELTPIVNVKCNVGTIVRKFRSLQCWGNTSTDGCEQTITILPDHDYAIRFPPDGSANCGEAFPEALEYTENGCDLLSVGYTNDTLFASGLSCYKVLRYIEVLNWCEWDEISPAITVSRDEDCDGDPGDEAVWVIVRQPNGETAPITFYDRDNNETNQIPLPGSKGLSCDGSSNPNGYWKTSNPVQAGLPGYDAAIASRGRWKYMQVIKVFDDTSPELEALPYDVFCSNDNVECVGAVDLSVSVTEACAPHDLTFKLFLDRDADGNLDTDDIAAELLQVVSHDSIVISDMLPIGSHAYELHILDGCGNSNALLIPVQVADCTIPGPVCINGLSTTLMPVIPPVDTDGDGDIDLGMAEIWASDYVASSLYDCSGQEAANADGLRELTTYTIYRTEEVENGTVIPGTDLEAENNLMLNCDDRGPLQVSLYVWDEANNPYEVQPDGTLGGRNWDFCVTILFVQDNSKSCTPLQQLSGTIAMTDGSPLPNVQLQLTETNHQYDAQTDANGNFELAAFGTDQLMVEPSYQSAANEGLTALDLVHIQRHIMGIAPLDSPYQIIAADANLSGSVSVLDLIEIQRLILGNQDEFAHGQSWRFIPTNHVFDDPAQPFSTILPEYIELSVELEAISNIDFVAIKIGDVVE